MYNHCKAVTHLKLGSCNTYYLLVIWTQDYPATKTVTEVDDSSTADESDNIWESCPECQDENLKIDPEHKSEQCTEDQHLETTLKNQFSI